MQLFFAEDFTSPIYTLSEEESKHAVRVLRLKIGDTLSITDGKGNLYHCNIIDDNPKRCTVQTKEHIAEFERRPYRLTMAVAPTKNNDRYEWFLEKATEVGIDRVVPLECEHSERRAFKQERGEKVIISAVKQSLKAYKPKLDEVTEFKKFITEQHDAELYIAHCEPAHSPEGKLYLADVVKKGENVVILIGPEGDFSSEEINFALQNGFKEITLGEQRLRTETAAIVATVMVATLNH